MPLIIGVFLVLYLVAGLFTELGLMAYKPLPAKLLDDFTYYSRALTDALTGGDPYAVREIGPAFLYPPPSLFVVELFNLFQPEALRAIVFIAVNVVLMAVMVRGVARIYGYSVREVWWWFVLAFGFAPFYELLHVGQINVITEFGIFLLFWGEAAYPVVSGLGLALAILTKVTPAVFFGYLFVNRRYKAMAIALAAVIAVSLLGVGRYGLGPYLIYPSVFRDLLNTFPLDLHSQSLVSKLTIAYHQIQDGSAPFLLQPFAPLFQAAAENVPLVQRGLTVYIGGVLLVSGIATIYQREREPFFIVVNLAMMLSPNIMWYHHYVFILLPLFVLMGWTRLKPVVVLWCLIGLLLIQIDRFRLTTGLLIHIYSHLTLLAVFIWQVRGAFKVIGSTGWRPAREGAAA